MTHTLLVASTLEYCRRCSIYLGPEEAWPEGGRALVRTLLQVRGGGAYKPSSSLTSPVPNREHKNTVQCRVNTAHVALCVLHYL